MPATDKTNWIQALHHYIALGPTRTYATVADAYGVTEGAVRRVAKRDEWRRRAAEVDRLAMAAVEPTLVDDRAARLQASLEAISLAREQILEQLRAGTAEVALRDLPALVKLEALLLGEPTERVAVADVSALFSVMVRVTARHVPSEGRPLFLADLDRETAGLLAALGAGATVIDGDAVELDDDEAEA